MTVTAIPQAPTEEAAAAKKEPKSKKKLVIIVVAVLALGGGGYWFTRPAPAGPPQPGDVVKLDAIQINLADAHYLRVAMALQLVKGVKAADGSKALDATIDIFSGLPMAQVNDPKQRVQLKKELEKELAKLYDKDVMGIYFTEFVTQ
jgi:flagellar FliL protein